MNPLLADRKFRQPKLIGQPWVTIEETFYPGSSNPSPSLTPLQRSVVDVAQVIPGSTRGDLFSNSTTLFTPGESSQLDMALHRSSDSRNFYRSPSRLECLQEFHPEILLERNATRIFSPVAEGAPGLSRSNSLVSLKGAADEHYAEKESARDPLIASVSSTFTNSGLTSDDFRPRIWNFCHEAESGHPQFHPVRMFAGEPSRGRQKLANVLSRYWQAEQGRRERAMRPTNEMAALKQVRAAELDQSFSAMQYRKYIHATAKPIPDFMERLEFPTIKPQPSTGPPSRSGRKSNASRVSIVST
jgi:hypothetical protein